MLQTTSRPRVVLVNNIVTPYTNRLYQQLTRQGLDLHIVSCSTREPTRHWGAPWSGDNPEFKHYVLPGLRVRIAESRSAYWNFGVEEALAKIDPHIVIVSGLYPTMLIAARWALKNGKALALTIDGWGPAMPNSIYHRVVRPRLLRHCSAVITPSDKGRDYFIDQGVPERSIFKVPLVPAWDPSANIPTFAEREHHLLWVAHMNDEVKNFSFFIEVAKALKDRIPGFRLRLVGQGVAAAQGLAALRAADISFVHEKSRNWREMEEVYRSVRLLALPSLWESWGLVCNEAMQVGVPCIVSPYVGAGGDLVQEGRNGFVRQLDVDDWARTIASVVTDETAWTRLSHNSCTDMASRSLDHTANAFLAMVEQIQRSASVGA